MYCCRIASRDRMNQRRGAAVEPAVRRVRTNGLHDVAGAHHGTRRSAQPIGDRGQPVLLAAVHMDHIDARAASEGGGERPPCRPQG